MQHLNLMKQFTTFYVSGMLYGIDVIKIQEVVKPLSMTKIPKAPPYITGLLNLRGQVATAIGLRQLFLIEEGAPETSMNMVCKVQQKFLSLQVDEIGDVIEVSSQQIIPPPINLSENIRGYLSGVVKLQDRILAILNTDEIGLKLGLKNTSPGA